MCIHSSPGSEGVGRLASLLLFSHTEWVFGLERGLLISTANTPLTGGLTSFFCYDVMIYDILHFLVVSRDR